MSYPERDEFPLLINHFHDEVKKNSIPGTDGDGKTQRYVPYDKQKEILDYDIITRFLANNSILNSREIQVRYSCVLSILAWISRHNEKFTDYIGKFHENEIDDTRLPMIPPSDTEKRKEYLNSSACPFPSHEQGERALDRFVKEQWRFLPLRIMDDRGFKISAKKILPVQQIRPFSVGDEIDPRPGSAARIFKATPHACSGIPPSDPIVLKEYPISEREHQFLLETKAYQVLDNVAQDYSGPADRYVLKYYGSFIQGEKCNIVLEYVAGGSLLGLFRNNYHLPRDETEARKLCEGLMNLMDALDITHTKCPHTGIIHQDVTPANILVTVNESIAPTEFLFKLGDFGVSSSERLNLNGDATGQDHDGSRMYAPPECCQFTETHGGIRRRITWEVDIWYLGCVYFETAVWMARHEKGRMEFLEARRAAISEGSSIQKSGYRGAFHNGAHPLPMLTDQMELMIAMDSPVSKLSAAIMDFVLEYMIIPAERKRLNAAQLKARFGDLLLKHPSRAHTPEYRTASTPQRLIERNSSASVTSTAKLHIDPTARPSSTQFSMAMVASPSRMTSPTSISSPPPVASLAQELPGSSPPNYVTSPVLNVDLSNDNPFGFHNSSTRPLPKPRQSKFEECTFSEVDDWLGRDKENESLPGWDAVHPIVQDRDQVVVIDNSKSMIRHWEAVNLAAKVLLRLAERIDPNGFDVYLTNARESKDQHVKKDKFKSLLGNGGYFKRNKPRRDSGPCMMESCLSTVLTNVIDKAAGDDIVYAMRHIFHPSPRGVNVYVLTDGDWGNGDDDGNEKAAGVGNAIISAAGRLKAKHLPRTFLSIQFIRFGDIPVGIERLRYLDDDLKMEEDMPYGWDIVDTTDHRGNVWKMIIGSLSSYEDSVEDVSQFAPHASPSNKKKLRTSAIF